MRFRQKIGTGKGGIGKKKRVRENLHPLDRTKRERKKKEVPKGRFARISFRKESFKHNGTRASSLQRGGGKKKVSKGGGRNEDHAEGDKTEDFARREGRGIFFFLWGGF